MSPFLGYEKITLICGLLKLFMSLVTFKQKCLNKNKYFFLIPTKRSNIVFLALFTLCIADYHEFL